MSKYTLAGIDTLLAEIKCKMGWNEIDEFVLAQKIGKVFVENGSINIIEDLVCSEHENKPTAEEGNCDNDS